MGSWAEREDAEGGGWGRCEVREAFLSHLSSGASFWAVRTPFASLTARSVGCVPYSAAYFRERKRETEIEREWACLTNECHLSKCDTICAKSCVNCTLFYCYTLPVPRGIQRRLRRTQRHPSWRDSVGCRSVGGGSCSSLQTVSWNCVWHCFLKCSHKIYIIIEGYALFRLPSRLAPLKTFSQHQS